MTIRILICALLVPASLAAAEGDPAALDHPALVAAAFARISDSYRETWAFRETRESADRILVGRYDPSREAALRWALESVDGRPPSADEIAAYRAERSQDDAKDSDSGPDIVRPGSLELVDATPQTLTYRFTPAADENDEDFLAALGGMLTIDRHGGFVRSLTLENDGPIRPATGVRIAHFRTRMTFASLAPGGPVVPAGIEIQIRGRAYLAVGFDESETVTWDDYVQVLPAITGERAGEPQDSPAPPGSPDR